MPKNKIKYGLKNVHAAILTRTGQGGFTPGGQPGRRFIFPHSGVMIHEPLISSSYLGNATSIEKTAQSILKIKSALNEILAKHTGKTPDEINDAVRTDNYMTAEEAVAYGLIDRVITSR